MPCCQVGQNTLYALSVSVTTLMANPPSAPNRNSGFHQNLLLVDSLGLTSPVQPERACQRSTTTASENSNNNEDGKPIMPLRFRTAFILYSTKRHKELSEIKGPGALMVRFLLFKIVVSTLLQCYLNYSASAFCMIL